jgi:hypothetical protein
MKKAALVRKTWPKIRAVNIKGQAFYRVDARRTGTSGRRETFNSQKDAEKRAGEIAGNLGGNGKEGLAFPAELRGMALTAGRMLQSYAPHIVSQATYERFAKASVSFLCGTAIHAVPSFPFGTPHRIGSFSHHTRAAIGTSRMDLAACATQMVRQTFKNRHGRGWL